MFALESSRRTYTDIKRRCRESGIVFFVCEPIRFGLVIDSDPAIDALAVGPIGSADRAVAAVAYLSAAILAVVLITVVPFRAFPFPVALPNPSLTAWLNTAVTGPALNILSILRRNSVSSR